MTTTVVITGGIGSGKSTFSNQIKKRGFRLLDSDREVSNIYKKPKKNFTNYLEKIGLGECIQKNKINKKKIQEIIFTDNNKKSNLEKYIFNIIRKRRKNYLQKEINKKTKIIFFDIPLLFENNLEKDFDIVVSIISKKKERYKRLINKKKLSKETIDKIMKTQTTDVERKNKSDIIIENNKSLKMYLKKIDITINKLIK